MKIYVGNLPWSVTGEHLEQLFGNVGRVLSASVISDRETGRSRGFGFVEMEAEDGQRAIKELNGHQLESRSLTVNEAHDRMKRQRSF